MCGFVFVFLFQGLLSPLFSATAAAVFRDKNGWAMSRERDPTTPTREYETNYAAVNRRRRVARADFRVPLKKSENRMYVRARIGECCAADTSPATNLGKRGFMIQTISRCTG